MTTKPASIPTSIQLPSAAPTQDPALAGYLAQLSIALNAWIVQVATAINQLQQKP
jgi:hypothetical protein